MNELSEQLREIASKLLEREIMERRGVRVKNRRDLGEGRLVSVNGDCYEILFESGYREWFKKENLKLTDESKSPETKKKCLSILSGRTGVSEQTIGACLSGRVAAPDEIPENDREGLYEISGIYSIRPKLKLPDFKGKEIIINGKLHKVNFISHSDEFGNSFLEYYKRIVRVSYKNMPLFCKSFESPNILAYILADQLLSPIGFRTATLRDIETIKEKGILRRGELLHTGLVLMSGCGEGGDYASHLERQIRERGEKVVYPSMIPVQSLELKPEIGPLFSLRKNGKVIPAPEFRHENNQRYYSKLNEEGLPIFDDGQGDNMIHTAGFGLKTILSRGNELFSDMNISYESLDSRVWILTESS